MKCWMIQFDRRTSLAKGRSCDEPSFSVSCGGMGDSMASPLFLVCLSDSDDPNGKDTEWINRNALLVPPCPLQ
jgi:hypothetical protein